MGSLHRVLAAAAACCLLLTGCGAPEEQADERPASSVPRKDTYQLGEKITIQDVSLAVASIEKHTTKDMTPGEGHVFCLVHVRVENDSAKEVYVNSGDFHLRLPDGVEINDHGSDAADAIGNPSVVRPDGSLDGSVLFEVPKDLKGLTLLASIAGWPKPPVAVALS